MKPDLSHRDLVSRNQMVAIAKEYNLFVTLSTVHRWANEPDFPLVAGQRGRTFLYHRFEFISFLKKHLRRMQEER